jgi:PAB1-binding protein PBP1
VHNWKKQSSGDNVKVPVQMSLYDDDGKGFNQFEGKKSTYKEDIYTTKLDYSKVTSDLKKTASKMEKEIQS